MNNSRLEAFSDGVIAIIITIMVLELKVPHGADSPRCSRCSRCCLSYVLSFVYVGIYWNNHHHMLHATRARSTAPILWANLHLLFWLSLFPFATAWMGENHLAAPPTALYGAVLLHGRDRLLDAAGGDHRLARAGIAAWRERWAATGRASSRR